MEYNNTNIIFIFRYGTVYVPVSTVLEMCTFKGDGKRNFTFRSKYNVTNNYFIPYQMHYHTQNNSTTSYHIFIKMIHKSLISKTFTSHCLYVLHSLGIIVWRHLCQTSCSAFVYKRLDQLTDKMSDSATCAADTGLWSTTWVGFVCIYLC